MNSVWPLAIFGQTDQNTEQRILRYALRVVRYPPPHLQPADAGQTPTAGGRSPAPPLWIELEGCGKDAQQAWGQLFKGLPRGWGSCFTTVLETLTHTNSFSLSQQCVLGDDVKGVI